MEDDLSKKGPMALVLRLQEVLFEVVAEALNSHPEARMLQERLHQIGHDIDPVVLLGVSQDGEGSGLRELLLKLISPEPEPVSGEPKLALNAQDYKFLSALKIQTPE